MQLLNLLLRQVYANFGTFGDTKITSDEFEIDCNNGVLTITNTEGRDIAIEDFNSAYGKVTVSSLEGLGGTDTLASQQALASEIRLTRGFGTAITAGTATLSVHIDGATTAATIDITAAFPGGNTGWQQAALIETAFQAVTAATAGPGTYVRVAYDSENDQFVISDVLGRSIEIRNMTGPAFATPGKYLVEEAVIGQANKANTVAIDSSRLRLKLQKQRE